MTQEEVHISERTEQYIPRPRVDIATYSHGGWNFEAVKGCISGRRDLDAIEETLHAPPSMPEMCFGANKLVVEHQGSGTGV